MTKTKSQAKLAENVIGELLPKYDLVFKKIFGDPRHTNILISFLNSIIECNQPITSIQLENVELVPNYVGEKWSRLDILATTKDGEIINVEIQVRDENNITKRALFYWSRIFSGQLLSGVNYNSLKRTITINVLDFNHFQDDRYWHKGFIIDPKSHELIDDSLEIHFLELKKMLGARGQNTTLEMWLQFMNNPYSEEVMNYAKEIPAIAEAQQLLAKVNSDPVAKAEWRLREKSIYDEASAMAGAREKGREEERIKAEKEKAKFIKNLLATGMSIEQVAMAGSLTSTEVEKLSLMDV